MNPSTKHFGLGAWLVADVIVEAWQKCAPGKVGWRPGQALVEHTVAAIEKLWPAVI